MTKDYLIHHGVKGMKWGVRKDPNRSLKGNLHRALAKNYEINERFYSKHTKNKALASMNANAKREQLKKANDADKNKIRKKEEKKKLKDALKSEKDKRKEGLRKVDPNLAKNATTRRVANDYHRLTNAEFAGKYKTTKKTFAKRYERSDGDTYSGGLKKQAIAMKMLGANNSSIMKATVNSIATEKAKNRGHEYVGNMMQAANDQYIVNNTPVMKWNGGFVTWEKR